MENMRERVSERMRELGLNPTSLAKKMGKRQSTTNSFLSGRNQTFRDITALAKALEVNEQWLLTGGENKKSMPNKSQLLQPKIAESMDRTDFGPDMLPILGYANASSSATMLSFDEPLGYEPRHPNQRGIKNAFFLKVYDESMMPRYNPEERVAVNGSTMPLPKKDCIVELANGERYLKQFIKMTTKEIICRQFNPDREWKRPIEEVKAIHAVVGGVW